MPAKGPSTDRVWQCRAVIEVVRLWTFQGSGVKHRTATNPAAQWRKEGVLLAIDLAFELVWPVPANRPGDRVRDSRAESLPLPPKALPPLFEKQHRAPLLGQCTTQGGTAHAGTDDNHVPVAIQKVVHGVFRPVRTGRHRPRKASAPALFR